MTITGILWALIWGYICCIIAERNNRNKIIAAILGAVFNIFAVIFYFIIGKR